MTLIMAGHHENLSYAPSVQDSGDLEAATKTITAVAEASGLANKDYQVALTLPVSADARIVLLRIAARLAVTIDSITAGQLNCRVYVDAQDANHRLFDLSWTTTGAKLSAVDTHAGALATIFAALKNGAEHTFYFFFWVDAGDAVLSLVELWEGVGSCDTGYWGTECLQFNFTGFLRLDSFVTKTGTGTYFLVWTGPNGSGDRLCDEVSGAKVRIPLVPVSESVRLRAGGSVATDLNYLSYVNFSLRSDP